MSDESSVTSGGNDGDLAGRVRALVRDVPDFPSAGILFKDITPFLGDGAVFGELILSWAAEYDGAIDAVAGIEARGFILGAPLAVALGVSFVPVRKAGKLPGRVEQASYTLEYGTATLEMTHDAVRAGQRVLLVDDVLATGGTAAAAASLVERFGATVVAIQVLAELPALGGRAPLAGRVVSATVGL